ncbi:MAG TPA: hypothetical protein VME86_08355 [Acidobacteriaceae bacterium]|nr:hypothetical protein [Acidobacteriaceae bacterium]
MAEDRPPDGAGVGGLPNATIDAAEVVHAIAVGHSADGHDVARAKRTDETPAQSAEELG